MREDYMIKAVILILFILAIYVKNRYSLSTTKDEDYDLNELDSSILSIYGDCLDELKYDDIHMCNEEMLYDKVIEIILERLSDIIIVQNVPITVSDDIIRTHIRTIILHETELDLGEIHMNIMELGKYKDISLDTSIATERVSDTVKPDDGRIDITSELNNIFFNDI